MTSVAVEGPLEPHDSTIPHGHRHVGLDGVMG